MKRLGLICCLLATPAVAEQPERLVPSATIAVGVGHTERLKFKANFGAINVASQGVVQATAQSDRVMTLFGQAEGVTTVSVQAPNGEEIYSATVVVSAEPGHVVRIYGRKDIPDYTGFYCTATFCGRADKELGGIREPSSKSITYTDPSGRSVTQSTGYGR